MSAGLSRVAVHWLQRRLDDPPVQVTISLLTPFAAYLPAEQLGLSGVLAVVTSGLYIGWRSPLMITARTRLEAFAFWRMVVFLLNGIIFILIGLQLPGGRRRIARRLLVCPPALCGGSERHGCAYQNSLGLPGSLPAAPH